jgi:diguanylate cyclase (GGDEF)-like protein
VAALVLPVTVEHTNGRRSSLNVAVNLAMGFALPLAWAILATAAAALIAGVHIRRYRTTPGGMLWGSSWVTTAAAAGLAAQAAVLAGRPEGAWTVVVATAAFAMANQAVSMAALWLVTRGVAARRPFGWPDGTWLVGLAFGMAAGALAADDPALMTFLAVPLAAVVLGGNRRTAADEQHRRLQAIFDLAEGARRETSVDTMEELILERAGLLLGARMRAGDPPGPGEIGTPFPSPERPDRWLVARRRKGPPTWQGEYRADERQVLATIAAVGSAASENIRLMDHIRHEAFHDPLTQLANRRLFDDELARRVADARRHGRPFAVVVVDLDHFKDVNDKLGHVSADRVLVTAAERLASACRTGDMVARWGGEEFVVLAELDETTDAAQVAQRLHEAVRGPCRLDDVEVWVTASLGAAAWPAHGDAGDQLLRAADHAMLAAKRAGRDRTALAQAIPGNAWSAPAGHR